jgi:DNA-binding CsgD family transcriptional regulator
MAFIRREDRVAAASMICGLGAFGVDAAAVDSERGIVALTEGFLAAGPPFALDAARRLTTGQADEDRRLEDALACARREGAAACALTDRDGAGLVATLRRLPGEAASAPDVILISLSNARPAAPDPVLLCDLFALTPAEARLASMVAAATPICDAARLCGVSLKTARSSLERIYQKTGVRRQMDLAFALAIARPPQPPKAAALVRRDAGPAASSGVTRSRAREAEMGFSEAGAS